MRRANRSGPLCNVGLLTTAAAGSRSSSNDRKSRHEQSERIGVRTKGPGERRASDELTANSSSSSNNNNGNRPRTTSDERASTKWRQKKSSSEQQQQQQRSNSHKQQQWQPQQQQVTPQYLQQSLVQHKEKQRYQQMPQLQH
ncbi:hypothetical protein M5D96_006494 [Drosophila gunungcola]|uniref:Uncharacterized protein n=1 Tax=Drosophila gunungcola TaxID=103775 RepID=A0A9Q0BQK5_9MUSC|nr:hypothetical protein M5D96_006494 [Drosophila gunungcola]